MRVEARRALLKGIAGALAPIAVLVLSEVSASGQTTSDLARSLDPMFQGLLARPGNLANTLQYAAGVAQTDDTEFGHQHL